MKTIYSVRDSLGGELWWTTGRKDAIRLAAELNEIGVGAVRTTDSTGKATAVRAIDKSYGMREHHLPVAVWRCAAVIPRGGVAT